MLKRKNIISLFMLMLIILPCFFLLSGCGEKKEVELFVSYKNEEITSEGKNVTIKLATKLDMENDVVVKVRYDDNSEKILEKGQDARRYQVDTNLTSSLEAGKTYYYKISYKNFGTYTINFNVEKYTNNITFKGQFQQTYNGKEFYIDYGATNVSGKKNATITWYKEVGKNEFEKIDSAPINAGTYKVQVDMQETSLYYAASASRLIYIEKRSPDVTIPVIEPQNDSVVTKLGDIDLTSFGSGFSWDNENAELRYGENNYSITYTPEDTENYSCIYSPVSIIYHHKLSAPTLTEVHGGASWNKVENATGYEYQIGSNTPVVVGANVTSVTTMNSGESIKVRALGDETKFYLSSDYSSFNFNPVKTEIAIPNAIDVIYNGEYQTAKFSNFNEDLMDIDTSINGTTQKDARTYDYYFVLKDKNYYCWIGTNGSTNNRLVKWTIAKKSSKYYGDEITYSAIYTGQSLCTYSFSTDLENAGLEWFDETIVPTCDNVTYYAKYYNNPNDKENYDYDTVKVTINLTKATPEYSVPAIGTVSGYTMLNEIMLPTGFSWNEGQTLEVGTKTYYATFTPTDTVNFATITNIEIVITLEE